MIICVEFGGISIGCFGFHAYLEMAFMWTYYCGEAVGIWYYIYSLDL